MKFLKAISVFHLCVLIILLPGCGLFAPWMAGEDASIEAIHADLDDLKVAVSNMDTNQDGKLSLNEGLIGAAVTAIGAITGTNALRNRARRQRGERVGTDTPAS